MRSIVNGLSPLGLLLVVVSVAGLVAYLSWLVVGRRPQDLGGYASAAETVRDSFGLFFGFVLALSIGSVTLRGSDATSATADEATAVAQLTRGIRSFPVKERPVLRSAINEYVHSVVEDEFVTMRQGRPSERTAASLDDLYATYQLIQRQGGRVGRVAADQVGLLNAVTERRRARLGLIPTGLPGLLLGFLIVGSIVFVALLYPATISNGLTRALISGATAAVIAFAITLTIVLDYPFSGFLRTKDKAYKIGALAQFWIDPTPPPIKPDTLKKLTPRILVGEWKADSFFSVVVFRSVGNSIHAAYRRDLGTINGTITRDGIFRGVWCQEPQRRPPHAGTVEFRLRKAPTADGRPFMEGRWRVGTSGRVRGGWNLTRIGTRRPVDLKQRLDTPSLLCSSASLRPKPK